MQNQLLSLMIGYCLGWETAGAGLLRAIFYDLAIDIYVMIDRRLSHLQMTSLSLSL